MWGANLVMSHAAVGMTGMWDPSKRFGEIVAGIENPRKMLNGKIFLLAPFLDGKKLDVDMPSTRSRALLIDHMESCHIVNEQMCRARLKTFQFWIALALGHGIPWATGAWANCCEINSESMNCE